MKSKTGDLSHAAYIAPITGVFVQDGKLFSKSQFICKATFPPRGGRGCPKVSLRTGMTGMRCWDDRGGNGLGPDAEFWGPMEVSFDAHNFFDEGARGT